MTVSVFWLVICVSAGVPNILPATWVFQVTSSTDLASPTEPAAAKPNIKDRVLTLFAKDISVGIGLCDPPLKQYS
jgi:hypothetical protein